MSDKVLVLEDKVIRFIKESLDELNAIRTEQSERLSAVHAQFESLTAEMRTLAEQIDKAQRDYSALREQLVGHAMSGRTEDEKETYGLTTEAMKLQASLEERYRNVVIRRGDLQKEEQSLGRIVSRSEKTGNRLRMVMNLISLPEDVKDETSVIADGEALSSAFRIAEREARSFARELHDGPTQSFSALGLTLEMAREMMLRGDSEAADRELTLALDQLRSGLSELRALLFGLSPSGIENGFGQPLNRLAGQVSRTWGAELTYKLNGRLEEVPVPQRGNIFKAVHQAVINAVKSGAPHVMVSIGVSRNTLRVMITDDGGGFDYEREKQAARERGSYGLQNMEERVKLQGGKFSVTSVIGKGTTISVQVPVVRSASQD